MRRKSMSPMTSRRRTTAGVTAPHPMYRGRHGQWMKRLIVLMVLILLFVAGKELRLWLLNPVAWPIRIVKVEGAGGAISPQRVKKIVATRLGEGFFGIKLDAVAKALTGIPWVYHADVKRRWPDALVIRLTPQQAYAYWDKDALLNRQGDPFRPLISSFPKGLPSLAGPDGKEHELMQRYLAAKELFASDGLTVVSVREDARRAYRLQFANGIELVIGRKWDTSRMARLVAVYARMLASKASTIARIDLRYPNGFAVAWRQPKTDGAIAPAKE